MLFSMAGVGFLEIENLFILFIESGLPSLGVGCTATQGGIWNAYSWPNGDKTELENFINPKSTRLNNGGPIKIRTHKV